MWNKLSNRDKIKLIYAYVISPLSIIASINGNIVSMYSRYGNELIRHATSKINSASLMLGLLGYLPIVIPPTIIRFVIPRRELKFGFEMYLYMFLAIFLTRIILFMLTGVLTPTLGLLDCLIIYCTLSFRAEGYSNISRPYRYGLTILTICAVFILPYVTTNQLNNRNKQQYLFPIWEAIVLCCVLNMRERVAPEQSQNASEEEKHQEPLDKVDILINIGLACIGRKTHTENPYLTYEQKEARHTVERPFLKLLAARYKTEDARKTLARHFMVYKEMTLFVIYAIELKKYGNIHNKVRIKLKERLSEGLSDEVITKRNELWREMSKKFYDSYIRTHDISRTLECVFWSTLNVNNLNDIFGRDSLMTVFKYSRKAIARERMNL